jgi:nicotinic acid mononucleotide adenylyltransferase
VIVVHPEPARAPASVSLLPGSFDPLTIAHAAMAEAALAHADLVALLYSVRTLPKGEGAPGALLEEMERLAWLERFREGRDRMVIAVSSHGLLADQVRAAADRFPGSALSVVIGSDKLLQLLDPVWYEDRDAALEPMFGRATVLIAVRDGDEDAVTTALGAPENARWRHRIERLEVPPSVAAVSSSEVRERLRRGEDVGPLVPEEVRALLAQRRPGS